MKLLRVCSNFAKVAVSIIVLYLGVRVTIHFQNVIVWLYTSLPRFCSWILDAIYLRSAFLQRVFSYRLQDALDVSSDSRSVAEDLARKAGLEFEYHTVTTKDGYTLTLHRCYLPTHQHLRRGLLFSPVFLMHGLMQNSESFLCGGTKSLACTLAHAGHDVWLGNNRGNKYSSTAKQQDCPVFWDFSIDELAVFDFPAAVEYVTQHTRSRSLAYIGFSQGTAQAFAALSRATPELSAKISIFIALAPAVFPCGFRDSLVSTFFSSSCSGPIVSLVFGSTAMMRLTLSSKRILSKYFFARAVRYSLYYLFSCNSNFISIDRQTELFQHVYCTSSVKCVKHWLQIIQSGCFAKYHNRDFRLFSGAGMKVDGANVYDLSAISVPVAVLYGSADRLVDAKALLGHLKTCILHKEILHLEHLELIWSDSAHLDIFPTILELLNSSGTARARNGGVPSESAL